MGRIHRATRRPWAVGVLSWGAREHIPEEGISEQMMGQAQPGAGKGVRGRAPHSAAGETPHWWV